MADAFDYLSGYLDPLTGSMLANRYAAPDAPVTPLRPTEERETPKRWPGQDVLNYFTDPNLYASDVLSGRTAASAFPGSSYDPSRSFAENATDPNAIGNAANIALGFSGGGLGTRPQPPALGFPQAKYPQYAEAYPEVGPPKWEIDKKTNEGFWAKQLTPEAEAFKKERARVVKDMQGGYEPYFNVSQRQHVDPANYPPNVDTTTIVPGPRAKTTPEQELATVGSDEARARLQAAYARGDVMPNTADWYAVKQIEDQFIKEYGPQEGRKQFQDKFATSMAATTGGANPEANFLMAMYGNYLRNQPGGSYPEAAHQMPFPIGGRYASGNIEQHQKIFDEGGFPSLGATNPKRHNFAQNFTGNPNVATMDEQMTSGMTPGVMMPPKGRYGIYEQVLAEEAAKAKADPRRFQEVAWAGFKNMKTPSYESGVPMMQTVNESIERTHRLTGLPKEEIVRRGLVRGEIPMYGLLGAIGLGTAGSQY
jgi:hypothetical protein